MSPGTYKFLADLVSVVHSLLMFCSIFCFMILISGAHRRNKLLRYFMVVGLIVFAGIFISNSVLDECLLWQLEKSLRMQYDPSIVLKSTFIAEQAQRMFGLELQDVWVRIGVISLSGLFLLAFVITSVMNHFSVEKND